jgi:hypothetical protein
MIKTVAPPTEIVEPTLPLNSFDSVGDTFTMNFDGKTLTFKKKDLKINEDAKKKRVPAWAWVVVFLIGIGGFFILLIYQGFTTPDLNIAEFILSESFDWFLVSIVLIIILGPFGVYGLYRFHRFLQDEFFKVRSGFIRVRKKLGNDRWQIMWKKPVGSKIKAKTEEGIEVEIPIKLEKDYMGWEGNVPFIEMDENLTQFPLKRTIVTIPKEHSTRMSYLAYLAGKISAWKEQSNLQLLLIIAIIAIVGIGAYNAYTTYNLDQKTSTISVQQEKVERIVGDLYNRTQTTPSGNQIPSVGG